MSGPDVTWPKPFPFILFCNQTLFERNDIYYVINSNQLSINNFFVLIFQKLVQSWHVIEEPSM